MGDQSPLFRAQNIFFLRSYGFLLPHENTNYLLKLSLDIIAMGKTLKNQFGFIKKATSTEIAFHHFIRVNFIIQLEKIWVANNAQLPVVHAAYQESFSAMFLPHALLLFATSGAELLLGFQ